MGFDSDAHEPLSGHGEVGLPIVITQQGLLLEALAAALRLAGADRDL
jgi:hypothetical protein